MTVTLTPELADLLARTGHQWPDADEDQLTAMADGWKGLQDKLTTVRSDHSQSAQAILAGNQGMALGAFRDWVKKFDGVLLKLVEFCARAEAILIAVARAVLALKKAILNALKWLARAIEAAKHAAKHIPKIGDTLSELIDKVVQPLFEKARALITKVVTKVADLIVDTIVPKVVGLIRMVKGLIQQLRKLISGRTGEHDWPTNPSQSPHPEKKPKGSPKRVPPNEKDPANIRATRLENEAAATLARAGYDIEQLPERKGQKNPDYNIEGKIFDCVAPTTGNARNVWTYVKNSKVDRGQADRVIINIDDSGAKVSVDALRKQFQDYPMPGLKEVKVIGPGGAIIDIYP